MEKKVDKAVTFILSTGRTGTQFFSHYLNGTCEETLCLHEPGPSRRFKWYSNFYLVNKLSARFIAKQYLNNRKKQLFSGEHRHYVESSNFLFACVEPVKQFIPELSVLHIIRHPLTYTRSHLNKGFWSGIKGFTARNIPGWLEFIDPEIRHGKDPVMILLARWIYVNRVLLSHGKITRYHNCRFEDLFGENTPEVISKMNHIRQFIGCDDLQPEEQQQWLKRAANKSPRNRSDRWPIEKKHIDFLKRNAGDLLETFNYQID